MYCVIQEVKLKKPNTHGEYRELKADSFTHTFDGVTSRKYTYGYGDERFERPIKKAYKVSIHESKRVKGVVTKQQNVVTTVGHYDLVDYWIGDCMLSHRLDNIAGKLQTSVDRVWELINAKVDTLQEEIILEFKKTEEYKAREKHKKIIERCNKAKSIFAKTYDCDSSEYDYCYNVFGELKNNKYLDKIVDSYNAKRSYQKKSSSNYSGYDWSNLGQDFGSTGRVQE